MSIEAYRRGAATNDPSADFARGTENSPIVAGQLVQADFAGAAVLDVRHGLAKAYRGALEVARNGGTALVVTVEPATVAGAAGRDTQTFLRLTASAATSAVVTLWIF